MDPNVYNPVGHYDADLEGVPDAAEVIDVLFKTIGKILYKERRQIDPQPADDIINFNDAMNSKDLSNNLRWDDCPEEYRGDVINLITCHWDMFFEEGLRKHIRGYVFHVDTGDTKPICCQPPRYGKYESKIIKYLCDQLRHNGMIEDDDGPWGSMVVLSQKAKQENTPWTNFIW